MKIANSALRMEANHAEMSRREVNESLRAWVGPRRPDFEGNSRSPTSPSTSVQVSDAALAAHSAEASNKTSDESEAIPAKLLLIKTMVERMTGLRIRLVTAQDVRGEAEAPDAPDPQSAPARRATGWGIEYDRRELREEVEHTDFAAEGLVRTADGREIRFEIAISMDRAWREESSESLRAGNARPKDPLVLNFDGQAVQLSATRFRFDLDGDGSAEDVPLLGSGSGYLALDLNGDGRINSGKELFGPRSGDGYAELAQHDVDGNGWIDENDPVFARLRIWSPAADGDGKLETLQERQVGALSLAHLATPFALRSGDNAALGAVRSSGIYLSENGQAGSLQQIDLMA
ncbi:MAG TPA: hypothetical protein PKC23_06780 [Candidatus Desulfobacillus sp.]|nr:hypothetical protein [Candidatus Desulfobacillus sp.]